MFPLLQFVIKCQDGISLNLSCVCVAKFATCVLLVYCLRGTPLSLQLQWYCHSYTTFNPGVLSFTYFVVTETSKKVIKKKFKQP